MSEMPISHREEHAGNAFAPLGEWKKKTCLVSITTTMPRLHHLLRLLDQLLLGIHRRGPWGLPPLVSLRGATTVRTICSNSLTAAISLLPKDLRRHDEGVFPTRNLSLTSAFNLLKTEALVAVTVMGEWNFSVALLTTSLATGLKWTLTFFDGSTWWKNVFGAPAVETKSPCLTSTLSYRSKDALGLTSSPNPIAKSSG
jgi:hypothetical protein